MHLWKYEHEGRALVVAPQKPVEVGHVEHDSAKLLDLYIQGRQEAKRLLAEIKSSLSANDGEPSKNDNS